MARRSAEYEDLSAREFDDMELFVREPFSFFGFAGSQKTPTSPGSDNSLPVAHTDAGLSKTKSETSSEAAPLHEAVHETVHEKEPVTGIPKKEKRGPRYDPKPTMDVASRRRFRASAGQNSDLLKEAAKDKNHPYHSTAIHMKQEGALRKNPKLLKQALNNPNHALYGAAHTVKAQNTRRKATLRAALKDENHPLHETAVAHRNEQHDRTIRNAQLKNPGLVEAALANKDHKLHDAAHRVAAQDNVAGLNALPFAS